MRLSTAVAFAASAISISQAAPFDYGTQKVRGVSVGGRLLLES